MEKDWNHDLRDAGLRVTAGRVAVLSELDAHPHSGVTELAEAVRSRIGST